MKLKNILGNLILLLLLGVYQSTSAQNPWVLLHQQPSVLALDQPRIHFETKDFTVNLVSSSQTIASLNPKSAPDFDFTPGDSIQVRSSNRFYHIGDINIRLRGSDGGEWQQFSTASDRHAVKSIATSGDVLAAANLNPTLPPEIPLQIDRYWEQKNGQLVLRFVLKNNTDHNVEIGGLGFPMIFNNILSGSLDEAHAHNVFYDPYIGMDAGYLQVTRLTGRAPSLLVLPYGNTPFEAYNPLLSDPTPRSITFEGFYEWMVYSKAYAENEWKDATPWNKPSSITLRPGEQKEVGFQFVLSEEPKDIEKTLISMNRPVVTGVPGYVLPQDVQAKLFLKYNKPVKSITSVPEGAVTIKPAKSKLLGGWKGYDLKGEHMGRSTIQIQYGDGTLQTIAYKVIKPEKDVVTDFGNFLTNQQWFNPATDTFHRNPSVISYDNILKKQITQENRAWIAGLSDEAGAGSWLGAMMKQSLLPDKTQVAKLETFVDKTLWGRIQVSEGSQKYGIRKSLFYYDLEHMPEGTYDKDINFKTWSAWPLKEANSTGRSYNYPHVTAAWWIMYRNARNYSGLLSNEDWKLYLENAFHTVIAMSEQAHYYAQFGQMEGTIFYFVLKDLKAEGMDDMANELEEAMKKRTTHWSTLSYPFGSEMPWDSTGQEEVYIWSLYFGYADKADVTLNAILGYMPSIPGWAYNGNARRYWDFLYAGKLTRIERMIHHYGSELNAIPVLHAYRQHPDNFYLLKVGYGGYLGGISNIEESGFAPTAFHAYPSTLANDGYTGDYGSGFFGYTVNSATYLVKHPDFGWLSFGGNLAQKKASVTVAPTTASRAALYIQPAGIWIKIDAGSVASFTYNEKDGGIEIVLDKSGQYNPNAYVEIEFPGNSENKDHYKLEGNYKAERGKFVIPLSENKTTTLKIKKN